MQDREASKGHMREVGIQEIICEVLEGQVEFQ